jgi:hypothetical protein
VIGSEATPSTAAQPFYVAGARVVTKQRSGASFGNDSVDTKSGIRARFGNDNLGIVRVRKRKLKGGSPDWRDYRARNGTLATTSASYDLVRAARVNGKPRHEFVLGLGSLKDHERDGQLVWFWVSVVRGMVRHGLAEHQRWRLLAEIVRKGARLPTIAQCGIPARIWPAETDEFVRWLHGRTP